MRINEILTEWKESYLYHATDIPSAISIWRSDSLRGGSGPTIGKTKFSGVSTTRNYNYALGYMKGDNTDSEGSVIFWINQDLVKRDIGRRRLKGYDWFQDNKPDDTVDDFQFRSDSHDTDRFETVITKGGLTPFRQYVSKIEIWLPKTYDRAPLPADASEDDKWQYHFSTGKFAHDYKNPDKHRINIRPDEKIMGNYLSNPLDKLAWDAMLRDPRTDVKKAPGLPRTYQGKNIRIRRQYDHNHEMHAGSERW